MCKTSGVSNKQWLRGQTAFFPASKIGIREVGSYSTVPGYQICQTPEANLNATLFKYLRVLSARPWEIVLQFGKTSKSWGFNWKQRSKALKSPIVLFPSIHSEVVSGRDPQQWTASLSYSSQWTYASLCQLQIWPKDSIKTQSLMPARQLTLGKCRSPAISISHHTQGPWRFIVLPALPAVHFQKKMEVFGF